MGKCYVNGCDNKTTAKGLCGKHYKRMKRHGETGINYSYRRYRVQINDLSMHQMNRVTAYEKECLKDIFYLGKHHGSLKINWNEAPLFE